MPSYADFLIGLKRALEQTPDAELITVTELVYGSGKAEKRYPYVQIRSKTIAPQDKLVLIRAGIHGDEVAGPLTICRHLPELFASADAAGVKLVIFPLDNPSGFEARSRYNIIDDRGPEGAGNNDFVRYALADGSFIDDLEDGCSFARWYWSSDQALGLKLPAETVALHDALRKLPLHQVRALIDLHQDNFISDVGAYHYLLCPQGYSALLEPIIAEVARCVHVFSYTEIGSGQASALRSDRLGVIRRFDGTLPDLLYHLGCEFCITVETTGTTPAEVADRVNVIWLTKILQLVGARVMPG